MLEKAVSCESICQENNKIDSKSLQVIIFLKHSSENFLRMNDLTDTGFHCIIKVLKRFRSLRTLLLIFTESFYLKGMTANPNLEWKRFLIKYCSTLAKV